MTIKSATPSGSQRSRAPGDERPWFKADIDAWALVRDRLPRPWPAALCMEDLKHLAARERFCRVAWDGQTALQERWGVSASTVKRYLAAARSKAGPALDQPWTTAEPDEAHQAPIVADERTSPGPALDQPWTTAEPVAVQNGQQVQLLEAPKSESESEIQNTIKPAKAGQKDAEQLWEAMEDERQRHAPGKRLTFGPRQDEVSAALRNIVPTAKELGVTPSEAIMMGWRWWWEGPNPWWRDTIKPATAPETFLRKKHTRDIVRLAAVWQAERYIPTADEALDAVLEVGCGAAEQRYPAGAKAIRQTFDYAMGGDLARMRAPKDPAKMRSAWASGFTKYLNAPALALVSR